MSTKFVGVTPVTVSSSCPPSPWFQVLLNTEANRWGGGGRRSVKGVLAVLRRRICVAGSNSEPLMGQAKSASQHISPCFKWEDFK